MNHESQIICINVTKGQNVGNIYYARLLVLKFECDGTS